MVPLIFAQIYPEEHSRMQALKTSMEAQKRDIIRILAIERDDPIYTPAPVVAYSDSSNNNSNSNNRNDRAPRYGTFGNMADDARRARDLERQKQQEDAKIAQYALDLLDPKWQEKVLFTGAHALLALERSLKFDGLSIPLLASLARWHEAVLSSSWEGLLACAHSLREAQLSGYMTVPGPYAHAPGPNVRHVLVWFSRFS
jgi:hypothetical protein